MLIVFMLSQLIFFCDGVDVCCVVLIEQFVQGDWEVFDLFFCGVIDCICDCGGNVDDVDFVDFFDV